MNRFVKLALLIAAVALLDVSLLSPGLIGLDLSGDSPLQAAAAVTLLFLSVLALLFGSFRLLFPPSLAPAARRLDAPDDYVEALRGYRHVKAMKNEIAIAIDQIDRLEKKKDALFEALRLRFDPNEMSYKRFGSVIYEVSRLFYVNIRGMLGKLRVFDASEYDQFAGARGASKLPGKLAKERSELYQEYVTYVSDAASANEEILLKLDKLLLETSRLGVADLQEIDAMPGMQEIDDLIRQTRYYRT